MIPMPGARPAWEQNRSTLGEPPLMTDRASLQTLLLDLIAPRPEVTAAALTALDPADWERLMGMVRQHRLAPLLHWQSTRQRPHLPIPADVREELAARFKRSTFRALVMRRELMLVHRLLAGAGIPCMALKGAYLAFHAYPQLGLRPLRDLDILVPQADALRAFEVLLAGGLVRLPKCQGTPEAVCKVGCHLPPLVTTPGQVTVEVHARLYVPGRLGTDMADPSEEPAFWHRRLLAQVGEDALSFPAPEDLLLHLIVHAAYHHQFSNGPLILSDIAYLLRDGPIDWPLFWRLAERGGQRSACELTLRLAEAYWGALGVQWPADGRRFGGTDAVMEQAARLMLRDCSPAGDVRLANELGRQGSRLAQLGLIGRRLFPPKSMIAAAYPVAEQSWRIYFYYLFHLWRLVGERVPQFFGARRQSQVQEEIRQLAAFERWLDSAADSDSRPALSAVPER